MLKEPSPKYKSFPPIELSNRQWPSRRITQAPQWLSTDLRDGNQAIFEPMDVEAKLKFFQMLMKIGFKEVEIGFPSASQPEFDFTRRLIEQGHIPEDVTIQVLTQARPELIERTMESLRGAKRAIVHVYTATSPMFRETVLGKSKDALISMTVENIQLIKRLAAQQPETQFILEYSPETFSQTELSFARDICDAVVEAWGATPENKIILNLPATVEVCMPNDYADMIEWMGRELKKRDSTIISVHPHNDRGTATAATEQALLAGADRVEGCLFGNGERTGNVDIVTVALNMYTQGIDPGLDFSDLDGIARTCEHHTQIPIHPRQPYAGELVYTAFSGSHQDAIKKGMGGINQSSQWGVPYLPLDPRDIGRGFTGLVRVNSQSGKGGIAFLLQSSQGIEMPRRLQIEFSGVVQQQAEKTGKEVSADQIWALFQAEYLDGGPIKYVGHQLIAQEANGSHDIWLEIEVGDQHFTLIGAGKGSMEAVVDAFNLPVEIKAYEEKALSAGTNAKAITFLELGITGVSGAHYGVGTHEDFVTASVQAVISGINRAMRQGKLACDFNSHPHLATPGELSLGHGSERPGNAAPCVS